MKNHHLFAAIMGLSAGALASQQDPTVFGLAEFRGGTGAVDVAIADFTSDGLQDVLYVNRFSNDLVMVVGVGVGRFQPGPVIALPFSSPQSMTTADFDLDGNIDVATLDDSGGISLLLGNGAGGFSAAPSLAASAGSFEIANGKLNGDFLPDLLVSNANPAGIRVWLGLPGGGFGTPTDIPLACQPSRFALADLESDGDVDIAAGCGSGSGSLLFGDGLGGFSAGPSFSNIGHDGLVAAGDLDGDGDNDLCWERGIGYEFTIWHQVAPATFQNVQLLSNSVIGAEQVSLADMNGDGLPDLAIVDPSSRQVGFFANAGNGTFQNQPSLLAFVLPPRAMATGDWNGDLRTDLAIAFEFTGSSSILALREGDGRLEGLFDHSVRLPFPSVTAAAADFNGDGHIDLATAGANYKSVMILLGDGAGHLQRHSTRLFPTYENGIAAGDLNGDSFVDVAVVDSTGASVRVVLGDGQGNLGASIVLAVPNNPQSACIADLDLDGDRDLLVTCPVLGAVEILLGDGLGGFAPGYFVLVGGPPMTVIVVDVDGDLIPDLVTANYQSGVSYLRGTGAGVFSAPVALAAIDAKDVAAADFDGDGDIDIAVADYMGGIGGGLLVYSAASPGVFGVAQTISFASPLWVAAGRFDELGPRSIALGDGTGKLITVRWNGSAFTGTAPSRAPSALKPPIADLDEDGRDDLALNSGTIVHSLLARGGAQTPLTYCQGKLNSMGCTPSISSTGFASVSAGSGFVISASQVRNQKPGLLFYGVNGPKGTPLSGGTLCVMPPIKRAPGTIAAGNPAPANDCSGVLSTDFNALITAGVQLPQVHLPGTVVHCQWWARDQGFPPPFNHSLSNGLTFVMQP
ncbi:MAG TPA: VCBS repeat-containing protein [Planctomycetota bacterium]|nr:VCBS repeat-containing protein [Planctomycetota bacterium]